MKTYGLENVYAGGAIGISLTAMAIVFSGLILISFTIAALPKVLDFIAQFSIGGTKTVSDDLLAENEDKDLASVVGLVMQMEEAKEKTEEIDIAQVIGFVLHLEHEQRFGLPN